ncbi:MAG: hypothetical protein KKA81_02520 [Bacteroidetes bacterium]|nr:hypothetical protein [Bacteroidota bacterium]
MLNRIFVLLLLFSGSMLIAKSSLFSQEWSFTHLQSIKGNFTFFTSDELGNIYLVNGSNLKKYDLNGNAKFDYSPMMKGEISFVDAGDPFKTLVYYEDFGIIEWLDNTLSPVSSVNLTDLGMELASLACSSYQNGIWLYLPPFLELFRYDQYLVQGDRSGNLFKASGMNVEPDFMVERDNILYLNDPKLGIFIFDKYGTFNKRIKTAGLSSFQILNRMIVFSDKDKGIILDPATMMEETFSLPEKDSRGFSILTAGRDKRIFLLMNDELKIYSIR